MTDAELKAMKAEIARLQRAVALEMRRRKREKKEARLCGK